VTMGGSRHRRKGTRLERELVARHKAFCAPPASTDPLIGASVELSDTCKCYGITVALIGAGSGSLRCASCGVHRGWLARETYDLTGIIREFGPLTAPNSKKAT
jgi:hypothetical protein